VHKHILILISHLPQSLPLIARVQWRIHKSREFRVLYVTRQFPNQPVMIQPSAWHTIKNHIQSIVVRTFDRPIHVHSHSYDPIVIYGMANSSLKGLRDQLSDKLTIPAQKIRLWKKARWNDRDQNASELLNSHIIQSSLFSTGLWMELCDP
jgi:hypothetical protein